MRREGRDVRDWEMRSLPQCSLALALSPSLSRPTRLMSSLRTDWLWVGEEPLLRSFPPRRMRAPGGVLRRPLLLRSRDSQGFHQAPPASCLLAPASGSPAHPSQRAASPAPGPDREPAGSGWEPRMEPLAGWLSREVSWAGALSLVLEVANAPREAPAAAVPQHLLADPRTRAAVGGLGGIPPPQPLAAPELHGGGGGSLAGGWGTVARGGKDSGEQWRRDGGGGPPRGTRPGTKMAKLAVLKDHHAIYRLGVAPSSSPRIQ